jgi:hypothetical protein
MAVLDVASDGPIKVKWLRWCPQTLASRIHASEEVSAGASVRAKAGLEHPQPPSI